MRTKLNYHKFENFRLSSGQNVSLRLSYQTFGLKLGKAPLVVVNHSLTGDSNISGDKTSSVKDFSFMCTKTFKKIFKKKGGF